MNQPSIKLTLLDKMTLGDINNLHLLEQFGEFTSYDLTLVNERISHIAESEVIITNKVFIDKVVIDACKSLKLICIAATGMNNVDLAYAAQNGIVVKNVAGYSTESVAQSTFAMLFHLLHKIAYFDNYVKSGEYINSPIFTHHGQSFWELKNKRFGIIGLGNIGKRVAEIAKCFGAEVVYYSTSGKNTNVIYQQIGLKELLISSDIVSIHCPLNDITRNLIGQDELNEMKSAAILLNTGRGGIVDEVALASALDNNIIAGAALDVLEREPMFVNHPLLQIKSKNKVLIMPHVAWASIESRKLLIEKIAKNIFDFLNSR